ncbi:MULTISPECIES: BolA/IbaG family iron-sulfur metabolism protein [Spongiibacter]|jgi:acid stress-induced BolA-like protein IbaG/YrbA|uniref:BolA family protein n=2 Tax=Spongiibacteraceae TaxID=1706375 RepID=UPI00041515F4|nr:MULTISPECIES: BolA/IbaG family iron-sulfur metabolism protein [Spongiibacter]MAK44769.1 cell division protein BolA [Spongiibacter sp.]MBM7424751.1 acid stress-induced BolA-like protein IbaG/YrbA [Spongiibacter marinus]MEE2651882.1 BolA/IbaG family iron-sulfur metabolism protein [Pseudomonadota bacterium]|tara:strand:+ start:1183 stop:1410 length:228 start_codon:yes stop_codon:yes gene_type:complete
MQAEQILARLREHFADGVFEVSGEGNHYDVQVISDAFAGLRPVKRQQLVYAAVNDWIKDGSLHAINIKALTPAEA